MSRADIEESIRAKKVSKQMLDSLWSTFDTDNDGRVSIAEYITAMTLLSQATPEEKLAL